MSATTLLPLLLQKKSLLAPFDLADSLSSHEWQTEIKLFLLASPRKLTCRSGSAVIFTAAAPLPLPLLVVRRVAFVGNSGRQRRQQNPRNQALMERRRRGGRSLRSIHFEKYSSVKLCDPHSTLLFLVRRVE